MVQASLEQKKKTTIETNNQVEYEYDEEYDEENDEKVIRGSPK